VKLIEEKYTWANTRVTRNKPDTIVVHHAEASTCTAQDIHRWHLSRGWKGIAYHYLIRKDGSIYRGRKEEWEGGHLLGRENKNTIGICLEGNYDAEKNVPAVQVRALVELCRDIRTRWNIKDVRRHADYPSTTKTCPGKYFPWAEVVIEFHKDVIQDRCKFSDPDGVWAVMDKHPYAEALYQKWSGSYDI